MSLRCGIPRAVAESLEGFADLAHGRGLTVKLGAAVDERWNADKVEIAAKIVIVEDRTSLGQVDRMNCIRWHDFDRGEQILSQRRQVGDANQQQKGRGPWSCSKAHRHSHPVGAALTTVTEWRSQDFTYLVGGFEIIMLGANGGAGRLSDQTRIRISHSAELRSQCEERHIDVRDDELWRGGLCVQHPSSPANDLFGQSRA
jgi:hypothetical protein